MHFSKLSRRSAAIATVLLASIPLSGCGRAEFAFTTSFAQNEPPVVCDPFDPANPPVDTQGLYGEIRYLEDSQPRYSSVNDMLANGMDAGVRVVVSRLDVPTVLFNRGFIDDASGQSLKKSNGDVLVEWFALDLRSELLLADTDSEGYYQFALLSDDGSTMTMDASATSAGTIVVDNDGQHETKFGCSAKAVWMKKNETRPIRVKYYQGPRNHIALTLMWRKVASETAALDASCGSIGNDTFFNVNVVPSAPKAPYTNLLARGWKPIDAKNFILPPDVRKNPCVK